MIKVGDSFEVLQSVNMCVSGIHKDNYFYHLKMSFRRYDLIGRTVYLGNEKAKTIGKLTITKIK